MSLDLFTILRFLELEILWYMCSKEGQLYDITHHTLMIVQNCYHIKAM